jgi:aspartyl-tRNA(Asn)/glutamyl-tRNA(Gln) amidotransferase subunit B
MLSLEPVIGLEVHVELQTRTKMFCGCAVVEPAAAEPNSSVCEICTGQPGTLPAINRRAVELALRAALALGSRVAARSLFARKNYFYPDLPKGFQISQYETPLAEGGALSVPLPAGERPVRIRRVHLEEDTGKLIHRPDGSLVDYNRSGVPLLEIVTEPDLTSLEEVKAFAAELRSLLRTLEVTSGDMEKGAIRFEANVSLRPAGQTDLGTRTEIKNLNSFRAMARAVAFEVERQERLLAEGRTVAQETRGWDEAAGRTVPQRGKEDAHDYRYFPEPDLPPLTIGEPWLAEVLEALPELPVDRRRRFREQFGLPAALAAQLVEDRPVADFFEAAAAAAPAAAPQRLALWITGELFGLLHEDGTSIEASRLTPQALGELVSLVESDSISPPTAKAILSRLHRHGGLPATLVDAEGLSQVADPQAIDRWVEQVLAAHPDQVLQYRRGKPAVEQWLFGQVMRKAGGRAKPLLVKERLRRQLETPDRTHGSG